MKSVFISLVDDGAPPSFERRVPTKRDLLGCQVAVFARSLDDVWPLLDDFEARVFGLLLTPAEAIHTTRVGPGLWHMTVSEELLPSLRGVAGGFLDALAVGVAALDENASIREALARSHSAQRQATEGYHESTERLGRRIEDLRIEIDRRKAAEDELRIKDFIIRSASTVIATATLDGTMNYVNPAFLETWRIEDESEVLGRPFTDFWCVADQLEAIMKLLLEDGDTWTGEVEAQRGDGTRFDVYVSGGAVFDDRGLPIALMSISTDVTERKRAEQSRRDLERQLLHAQKLESLGVLAGGVAHDFNNLLVGILGNAELALDGLPATSPVREQLRGIADAAKRAAELSNQMLAYSGKGQFVIEEIRLGELVDEMADLLRITLSKRTELQRDLEVGLPTFDGDATQIRQIIMNLITNASDAIGDGGGVIRLSTGTVVCDRAYLDDADGVLRAAQSEPLPEGTYVYVQVEDDGGGMTPETLAKIFDPFFSTKFTGRGLGMSAVLGIVRGHNALIKISSRVGEGSTFRVLFPATAEASVDAAPDHLPARQGRERSEARGTILLADDEAFVRDVCVRMLERLGFTVLAAPDGRAALELFREHAANIVCVMLDLTMPEMNGDDALREMQRIQPEVRGILCSGYSEQEVSQRFDGPVTFVQKPFRLESLERAVHRALAAGAMTEGSRS